MGAPIILSSVSSIPNDYVEFRGGVTMTWTGWDGSVWDLTEPRSGVALTNEGTEGLHFPTIGKQKSRSRVMPGARTRGWQADVRSVFWPIYLYADGSDEWRERQEAFFRTIHPDRPGTWTVKTGDQVRTIQLTGVFDDSMSYEADPVHQGWAFYAVKMEADAPYWQGPPITPGTWRASSGRPFFPGPPFRLSSANVFAKARLPNPGDVEFWPTWTMGDALDNIVVGVDGRLITVPFSLIEGERLVIYTDPRAPKATVNGVDVMRDLGLQDFAPVPPGVSVPLTIAATGAGFVSASGTPQYFRAF